MSNKDMTTHEVVPMSDDNFKDDKNVSFDGIFKELMEELPDETVIETINGLFGKNYPLTAKVARLDKASHLNGTKRMGDMAIGIDGDLYIAEIQSTDENMALRVFEYANRAAWIHGKTVGSNYLRIKFPQCVVFFLRGSDGTREVTIELELPDGNEVTFKIPAKHLCEYTLQDLGTNQSMIFAPFYPILYEKKLAKSSAELSKLRDEAVSLLSKIASKFETGELRKTAMELITNSLEKVLRYVMTNSKIADEEAGKVMEAVRQRYHIDVLNWREEGRIEGEKKGRAEGKAEGVILARQQTAYEMFEDGMSVVAVAKYTKLQLDYLEKLRKKVLTDMEKARSENTPDDDNTPDTPPKRRGR